MFRNIEKYSDVLFEVYDIYISKTKGNNIAIFIILLHILNLSQVAPLDMCMIYDVPIF